MKDLKNCTQAPRVLYCIYTNCRLRPLI